MILFKIFFPQRQKWTKHNIKGQQDPDKKKETWKKTHSLHQNDLAVKWYFPSFTRRQIH